MSNSIDVSPKTGCGPVLTQFRVARDQHSVQAEKLAAAGELIGSVAHEINNPLAVVLGHVNLAIRELGPTAWSVRAFFTTKGAGQGSGLGLSVSTGLIRRYGGSPDIGIDIHAGGRLPDRHTCSARAGGRL
ncbi:MAG: hypothetical protein WBG92_01380 [Thiohalocapsa sp.]